MRMTVMLWVSEVRESVRGEWLGQGDEQGMEGDNEDDGTWR